MRYERIDHSQPSHDCVCTPALRETDRRGHVSTGQGQHKPDGGLLWVCRYCGVTFGGQLDHNGYHHVRGRGHVTPCVPWWHRRLMDLRRAWRGQSD